MADEQHVSPIEQAIRKAIREGLFDNLPGTGEPLDLGKLDDPNTPDDMRLAYKVMKDNDITPGWIALRERLEEQQFKIRRELARGRQAYMGTLRDADRAGNATKRAETERAWKRLLSTFEEAIAIYNDHVLTYNLKVPHGIRHRHFMELKRELDRLETD